MRVRSERSEPFCQVIGKGSRLSGERQLERPPVDHLWSSSRGAVYALSDSVNATPLGMRTVNARWYVLIVVAWRQSLRLHRLSDSAKAQDPMCDPQRQWWCLGVKDLACCVQQEKANIEIFQWNWPGTFCANPKREKEGMMRCSATSQQMMSVSSQMSLPPRPHLRTHLRVVGFSCYSCWLFFSCYSCWLCHCYVSLLAFLFLFFLLAFLFLLFLLASLFLLGQVRSG